MYLEAPFSPAAHLTGHTLKIPSTQSSNVQVDVLMLVQVIS